MQGRQVTVPTLCEYEMSVLVCVWSQPYLLHYLFKKSINLPILNNQEPLLPRMFIFCTPWASWNLMFGEVMFKYASGAIILRKLEFLM